MMIYESGVEMDTAVAQAIGLKHTVHRELVLVASRDLGSTDSEAVRSFRPSVDWNDAMTAAHASGLFRSHVLYQGGQSTLWYVSTKRGFADQDGPCESDASGPMAICQAILGNVIRLKSSGMLAFAEGDLDSMAGLEG